MKGKLVTAALTTAAAIAVSAGPILAVSVEVSENGSDSDNSTNVTVNQTVDIFQSNNADVSNDISAGVSTGGNSANDNTGGDVEIETGDAAVGAKVSNDVNRNHISLGCCKGVDAKVKITNNGSDTENRINLNLNDELSIVDQKFLNIDNYFDVWSKTGDNEGSSNTGGDVVIKTGDANAMVAVDNKGNENVIIIGGLMPKDDDDDDKEPIPGVNPVPNLPTPGSVRGVAKLPMTGFDYPFVLIGGLSTTLVGLGVALRLSSKKEVEVV